MPPVFGPLSPSKARLWSCAVVERDRGLAVAQREEGGFLAVEEFLDHDFDAGLAQAAAEHHVDRRFGLGEGLRHHDALAGGEPVGLDHDRRTAARAYRPWPARRRVKRS